MLVAASSASSAAGEDAVAVSGTEGAAGPLGSFVVVGYLA